jgi:Ser/Thr protein kinase RdoA (MazF antagonist)
MSSGVVRVGNTVRRPAGPWTPAVHALLGHLHAAGFRGAPRPLGLDERGREILTFIPGTAAWPDNFHWLGPDDRLRHVARLIREFHDAAEGFRPPPDARWQVLIPAEGTGIIAHHDLAPWNLIIGARQWAFIDWDTAAPGSRLWDVAYALHGFVPLSANHGYQRGNPVHRMGLFADVYGLDQVQREQLLPMLPRRTRAMHAFLAQQAANGTQPWARLWQQGHGDAWRADTEYIARQLDKWRQALLG